MRLEDALNEAYAREKLNEPLAVCVAKRLPKAPPMASRRSHAAVHRRR